MATKVVHLGDQLEGSNNRRMRASEAIELLKYLEEFKTRHRPNLAVFTDPGRVRGVLISRPEKGYPVNCVLS